MRAVEESAWPQILDCTFRDGGYYNNWDFSDVLFSEYLSIFEASQVSLLEVGFRLPPTKGFRGAHAYTTDDYLNSFVLPENKRLGVMLNAGDFASDLSLVNSLFAPGSSSPIDFVRIASHESEVGLARAIAQKLLEKGYDVAINLMQMSEVSNSNLSNVVKTLNNLQLFSFYLADSLGAMRPDGVAEKFQILKESTDIPLGLHAHDNLGLAFQNSMVAVENGATYVDGTLRGMGRGPGNTKTEELSIALHRSYEEFAGAQAIGRLSDTTWAALQDQLGWGRNLAYFTAGLMGVHPTYVQELLSDSRYDENSVLEIVRNLSNIGAKRFDKDKLNDASETGKSNEIGQVTVPRLKNWEPLKRDEAVILGPGRTLEEYQRVLRIFLSKRSGALVLFVNDSDLGLPTTEHYRVISHRRQVTANQHYFADPNTRLIAPFDKLHQVLPKSVRASFFNVEFRRGSDLRIVDGCVESSVDNVFSYACALAQMSGVKRIYIAGFDGIGGGDSRDFDMAEALNKVQKNWGIEVLSLTPSALPVEVISPLGFGIDGLDS